MRKQTCCFTGHRNIPIEQRKEITKRLDIELRRLIAENYCYFGAGGALGFDTLAAQTVLQLRHEFPAIKLILVLPCKDQASKWSVADQRLYEHIKSRADKVVFLHQVYSQGCMYQRNRHLVNHSSVCLCYLTKQNGGTAYTVRYARQNGLRVINIAG